MLSPAVILILFLRGICTIRSEGMIDRMVSKNEKNLLVFTGNWNKCLVNDTCSLSGLTLGKSDVSTFSDGEIKVDLQEEILGCDVVIIQSTSPPVNRNLIELLFMISAARKSGAKQITAIIPYFGYARQDRKPSPGSNISASDVARMLELTGVDRVISFDLHSAMCQGFFGPRVQVDNLSVIKIFIDHLVGFNRVAVVSPDAGAYARSIQLYDIFTKKYPQCDVSSAMIFKQRLKANELASAQLCGDVKDRDVIIADDIVDTAGTLCKAAEILITNGAKSVTAVITHGIFSGPALQRIRESPITRILTTDSIAHSESVLAEPKIQIISLAQELSRVLLSV
ncbi:ribose-phosphate diphosphokinase family protein [Babesia bovis T2Bo]|uniref:ribose-phosphate diphosphokinase n=1 Tax=Babesia bovis TaxID=5865 RepID=A7ARJ1_BABBO|nr:ribose-phosphate diphosphokinase family protein [Babesia bovis T2Bo]EDO07160.1 ribose-phosphate diphosphokinase family protein [Babesia bovis T2Bo]|eukprot:XP_001610728.1 ribose-phosphate pyrophosphokinase [Babesia bovis T2Bo]